jgi:chemotaxis protein CheD
VTTASAEVGGAWAVEGRPRIFLQPGQLHVASGPLAISTVLGSCVAVCLWDRDLQVGGMNHYLLPYHIQGPIDPWRYGAGAIDGLLAELERRGSWRARLRAKIFGGACVLEAFQGQARHLGERNVTLARERLAELGIAVDAEAVGGNRGRKVIFHTDDGSAWVKTL